MTKNRKKRESCPKVYLEHSLHRFTIAVHYYLGQSIIYLISLHHYIITICLMIFVNYGGGGYYFFQHAVWNGKYSNKFNFISTIQVAGVFKGIFISLFVHVRPLPGARVTKLLGVIGSRVPC